MVEFADIVGRLRALEKRERNVKVAAGLLKLLVEAVGLFFVWLATDWLFRFPYHGRFAVGVVVVAMLLHGVWLYILAPLRKRAVLDELALRVEKAYPGLEDRLISALQLSREDAFGLRGASPALIEALLEDCKHAVAPLDFSSLITLQSIKRFGLVAVASVCLGGFFTIMKVDTVRVFLARCAGAEVPYPTRTVILAHSPSRKVLRGDPFPLEARVTGEIPEAGEAEIRSLSGDSKRVLSLRLEGTEEDAEWGRVGLLRSEEPKSVIENLECTIRVGDAVSAPIRVMVADPPQVAELEVSIIYPEYTGVGEVRLPSGSAEIRALVGSTVRFAGTATKPLRKAVLSVYPRNEEGFSVPLKVGPEERFSGELSLEGEGFYEMRLVDTDGFEDQETIRSIYRTFADTLPEIAVEKPGDGRTWLANAVWPLWGTMEDDFGIAGAKLVWSVSEREDAAGEMPIELPEPETTKDGRLRYRFKVSVENLRLDVKLNDEVIWKVVAWDNRPSEPRSDESREYSFTVVDWTTKMQEILDLREELSREISRLSEEEGRLGRELPEE